MPPHYIEVRRTNFLQSVLSPPLSLFSASQRTRGAHRLFAHMRPHMSVKTQEDPLNLHIFHLDMLVMKKNPIKIFGGRFWSYSRVVRFYLQFNPGCTSRGFNYPSIFLHDTTSMLDVPRVGKRRQTGGVGNTASPARTSYYLQAHLTQSHYHHISRPPCDT